MEIVINTQYGTFIVPREKHAELVFWLQNNAIKAGQQTVQETQGGANSTSRQLLSENQYRG